MKINAVYLRVSSEEQKQAQTIRSQREAVEQHCKQQGVAIGKTYADDGVSGTLSMGQRSQGRELLQDAKNGGIDTIFILKYDRMGRNLRDYLNLKHQLKRYGVRTVSVTQPIPDTPAGRMLEHQLLTFAEFDRETILENTARGQERRARDSGFLGGHAHFGYKVDGERRTAKLVPHDKRAETVLRMFEMYDQGKTTQQLADYLNEQGIPTPRQNPGSVWRSNSVHCILRNRVYTGRRQWRKRQWIKVEDEFGVITRHLKSTPERVIEIATPRLVPQDLFDRVQAKLSANLIDARAHAKNEYQLRSGKIRCGVCGRGYIGAGKYYSCVARHRAKQLFGKNSGKKCAAPLMRRKWLDGVVWFWCEQYLENPDKLALELAERQVKTKSNNVTLDREIAQLESALAKQDERRERVEDMRADDKLTKEGFDRQIQRIEAATEPTRRKLAQLREEQRSAGEIADGMAQARSVLEKMRSKGTYTFEEKKRIMQVLVDRVTIDPLPSRDEVLADPNWSRDELLQIDFKFHWERPRRRGELREEVTAAEAQAGADALLIASGATP